MERRILPKLGIVFIVETGLIHLVSSPHAFEHTAYLGYLFIINFLAALLAGYGIYRHQGWGWALGFALSAASLAGYVMSRTVGLPGVEVKSWLLPSGLLAIAIESLFILIFILRPWRYATRATIQSAAPSFFSQTLPALAMFLMVIVIGVASHLDSTTSHAEGDHLASLVESTSLTALPMAAFEQQYGAGVAQVAISESDSLIEVRLEVVDPNKADALLKEYVGLYVDGESFIPAPGLFVHGEFKPGTIFVMFFPNQGNTVHPGSQVSLVFDHLRVEPVSAE